MPVPAADYNPNIPQPTDLLSQSQSQILDNFGAIQTLIDVNHEDFANANAGKHKWVTFPIPSSSPTFSSGEEGLYNASFNNGSSSVNELFVHKQTSSGTAEIPFTASILSQNATPSPNSSGWSYLPSGLLIQWVRATGVSGLTTVTLSGGTPAFNAIMTVIVCNYSTSTSDDNFSVRLVAILSTTQFQIYCSSRTSTGPATGGFQALLIGY